ncbi:MAG TPA: hypothetical protein VFI86_01130 [Burkholderiales bacterium]|nr:hypothetical protein [Burkholderiales bacterium]
METPEKEELLAKLDLIEEQARLTLEELPHTLKKERQRMIISLVKHIRWAATDPGVGLTADPEATVKLSVP